MNCEVVREYLGAWLDGELEPAEAHEIKKHTERCSACSEEKRQLTHLQASLETTFRVRASTLEYESFWNGVRRRILEEHGPRGGFVERLRLAFFPPRLVWAVPLVIVFILGALFLEQFFPKWRGGNNGNLAAVESVDGHGFNVAVFRESKTKTTVIWLFQNEEEQDESSAESAPTDPAF